MTKYLSFALIILFSQLNGCLNTQKSKNIPVDESLDFKIGQMFMVGFRGCEIKDDSPVIRDISKYHLGGVILFDYDVPSGKAARNIKSPQQLKKLTAKLQSASKTPLFVAIDQEGGKVSRLKETSGFAATVSAEYLGEKNDPNLTYKYSADIAKTLEQLGINLNLAPVIDLNINPENPVIGKLGRSFSNNPETVTSHALEFIRAHNDNNILCSLKHFPGHGSSKTDSHTDFVDVTSLWSSKELIPYEKIIAQGKADIIMTAHIFNAALDENYPATLSHSIITDILRTQLFYEGVIISDDIQMKAIAENFGFDSAIELAINAGVDIILIANNSVYEENVFIRAVSTVKRLIEEKRIRPEKINESYNRIKKLKDKLSQTQQISF